MAQKKPSRGETETVELGQPFTLRLGASTRIEAADLSLLYAELVGDSRCPPDVTCVWAGDAQIRLAVTPGEGEARDVMLHTHGGERFPRSACAGGHTFRLLDLTRDGKAATLQVDAGCE